MQVPLLTRYAASLEEQRNKTVELYEQYINDVLAGQEPEVIAQIGLPDGRTVFVEPYGRFFQADLRVGDRRWRYSSHVQALAAALTWRGYAANPPGKCSPVYV